jgi:hypothetical protein
MAIENNASDLVIDPRSFAGMVFVQCAPKLKFGGNGEQEHTEDGRGKWELQVMAGVHTRDFSGNPQVENRLFSVSITSRENPSVGLGSYQPVELKNLRVSVRAKNRKTQGGGKEITGVAVYLSCDEIVNAAVSSAKVAA